MNPERDPSPSSRRRWFKRLALAVIEGDPANDVRRSRYRDVPWFRVNRRLVVARHDDLLLLGGDDELLATALDRLLDGAGVIGPLPPAEGLLAFHAEPAALRPRDWKPAAGEARRALGKRIANHCESRGVLVRPIAHLNVMSPPLTLTKGEVDELVDALLAEDGNIRLVLREWPILSEGSAIAARAALAARKQNKYAELHNALMGARAKLDEQSVLRIAGEVGLDVEQLKVDMQSPEVEEHIATSLRLAEALGFNGTPSFVVGDQLIPGFVEKAQLAEVVAAARAAE